jgi:hypothetical protein
MATLISLLCWGLILLMRVFEPRVDHADAKLSSRIRNTSRHRPAMTLVDEI